MLAGILQKSLDAIPRSERDAIYHDWISMRYQHGVDYGLLWQIMALAALILDKHALSEREMEVLRRLAEGQRIKEIADALSISAKTVETYRSRIMLKLGIDNLPGLVKFAIRAGIASSTEY